MPVHDEPRRFIPHRGEHHDSGLRLTAVDSDSESASAVDELRFDEALELLSELARVLVDRGLARVCTTGRARGRVVAPGAALLASAAAMGLVAVIASMLTVLSLLAVALPLWPAALATTSLYCALAGALGSIGATRLRLLATQLRGAGAHRLRLADDAVRDVLSRIAARR